MNGVQGLGFGCSLTSRVSKRTAIIAGCATLLFAAVVGVVVWRVTARPSGTESQRVIAEVGKLYMLPSNETPTVAKVKDVDKLSGQAFYKDARNGDYLLVYSKSGLALIYRESQDILVRVGDVHLDQ